MISLNFLISWQNTQLEYTGKIKTYVCTFFKTYGKMFRTNMEIYVFMPIISKGNKSIFSKLYENNPFSNIKFYGSHIITI